MLLVCEGRCNGHVVTRLDVAATEWHKTMTSSRHVPVEGELREELRALRHTKHTVSMMFAGRPTHYTCTECGHERRYG